MLGFNEILVKKGADQKRVTVKIDPFKYHGYTLCPVLCSIQSIIQSGDTGLLSVEIEPSLKEVEIEIKESSVRHHLLIIIKPKAEK